MKGFMKILNGYKEKTSGCNSDVEGLCHILSYLISEIPDLSFLQLAISTSFSQDRVIWTELPEDNLIQKVEGLSVLL